MTEATAEQAVAVLRKALADTAKVNHAQGMGFIREKIHSDHRGSHWQHCTATSCARAASVWRDSAVFEDKQFASSIK